MTAIDNLIAYREGQARRSRRADLIAFMARQRLLRLVAVPEVRLLPI